MIQPFIPLCMSPLSCAAPVRKRMVKVQVKAEGSGLESAMQSAILEQVSLHETASYILSKVLLSLSLNS